MAPLTRVRLTLPVPDRKQDSLAKGVFVFQGLARPPAQRRVNSLAMAQNGSPLGGCTQYWVY